MSRKKKDLPVYREVEIQDVAAEGKALVRIDDLVVFVPYVVPGDVVDLASLARSITMLKLFAHTSTRRANIGQKPFVRIMAFVAVASGRYCHTRTSFDTSRSK